MINRMENGEIAVGAPGSKVREASQTLYCISADELEAALIMAFGAMRDGKNLKPLRELVHTRAQEATWAREKIRGGYCKFCQCTTCHANHDADEGPL